MIEMITIHIRAFSLARQVLDTGEFDIQIPEGSTVAFAKHKIIDENPSLEPYKDILIAVVNRKYVAQDTQMNDGDELAIFPPVSGGHGGDIVAIARDPIDVQEVISTMKGSQVGALVSFIGTVREFSKGRKVSGLEYHAYDEMACERLMQVVKEARNRWPKVIQLAAIQRIGELTIRDISIVIVATASHRDDGAFEAVRYMIDRIKEIVPVWKKEHYNDESGWVVGDHVPIPDNT
ncbi:MAG: molybdenum cofactor biosynthesis protein MoaE [Chloroflexota bacterium]